MPCEEGVKFVCDGVSRVFDFPEVFRFAALVGVVDACSLAIGPVNGLQVSAGRHAEGAEVPCKV